MWMLVYLIWLTVKSKLSLLPLLINKINCIKKNIIGKLLSSALILKRKVDIWEKRKKIPGLGE